MLDDLEDALDDIAVPDLPLCPLRPSAVFGTVPVANVTPPAGTGAFGTPPATPPGLAPKLNAGGRDCGTAAGRACGTAAAARDVEDDDEPKLNNRPREGEGMGFTPAGGGTTGAPAGLKANVRGKPGTALPGGAGDAPGKGIAVYAGGGGGDNGCCGDVRALGCPA